MSRWRCRQNKVFLRVESLRHNDENRRWNTATTGKHAVSNWHIKYTGHRAVHATIHIHSN